jgi:hypothetical protein
LAGIILKDDDFAGLALDAQLHLRAVPVSDNGGSYGVDPSATAILGGGSNTVKFMVAGACWKVLASTEDIAVQLMINDNGGNEHIYLFLRDNQSTPAQRYGYRALFITRENITSGVFYLQVVNNYAASDLIASTAWTFASNGINKLAIEAAGNNLRVIINDVVAGTATNTTFAPNTTRKRCGVAFGSAGPSSMRATRFSVYDSIILTPPVGYPVVRFG